jgi:PelA/Pel-15E family pectate lyase
MRSATRFMTERVAHEGGYVWSYLPDLSRRWGEMEAKPSMIWIQSPGTPAMGEIFLDAHHVAGEPRYLDAAVQVADALVRGQHASGGWNYFIDTAGEASARDWYQTIGWRGRRLEEFRHYYGNATFDDGGTIESGKLLLRLFLKTGDARWRAPLERVIGFVLDSQYRNGGWPQRFPINREYSNQGLPDYTANITFNDDVAANNVEFLVTIYQTLGDTSVLEPLRRGMDLFLLAQQPQPQPGWALQYDGDLRPAGARTSEPPSLATHTTFACCLELMRFYRWTGDRRYLARIPEAIAWLEKLELPSARRLNGFTHPTFIEVGTDRPLYLRESGSWTGDTRNRITYEPRDGVSWVNRSLDLERLRRAWREHDALTQAELARRRWLMVAGPAPLPAFSVVRDVQGSDLNIAATGRSDRALEAARIVAGFDSEGYWPVPLSATSNPYRPDAEAARLPPSRTASGDLIDARDTSPFIAPNPVTGISTGTYINNMSRLVQYLYRGA